MPLPSDEKLLELSEHLLQTFAAIFGEHPGFRPAHAKGILLTGKFTPSPDAARLSTAQHFSQPTTQVYVRLSNSTGLPLVPDNDPHANPKGMAVRFMLGERKHTDIVAHSTDGFPVRTGEEFLEFLKAVASSDPAQPAGSALEAFLATHPAAVSFLETPKPFPQSYATESYFGVTAMRFLNAEGFAQFGRYQIVPAAGNAYLTEEQATAKGPDYLAEEMIGRIPEGAPKFKLRVQLAAAGDVVDDATIHWPAERTVLELGTLALDAVIEDGGAEAKQMIFDPIPRIPGIEPSDDPLLELRAAIYLMSGKRRRAA